MLKRQLSDEVWSRLEKTYPGITAYSEEPLVGNWTTKDEMKGIRFIVDVAEKKLAALSSPAPKE